MQLNIKKLHTNAQLPTYGTKDAACFDLYAFADVLVPAVSAAVVKTGITVEVPQGHALMVYSRSGHGFKNGVRLGNCVGIIDADYRGEVMVKLQNDSCLDFEVRAGDRIAQGMVVPVPQCSFAEVAELSETERGVGGFGSTGV